MAELLVVFREVFEAALIIGILYTYLNKIGAKSEILQLWKGVMYAVILSVIASFLFYQIYGEFTGVPAQIFEGITMIVAAIVLATMVIWMAKNHNIADDLKLKAQKIVSDNKDSNNYNDDVFYSPIERGGLVNLFSGYGILGLAFIAVFREGVETILFLNGIYMNQGGVSIVMSIIGACIGLFAGYLIFVQGRKLPIKKFFNITSVLLIFIASGMLAYGIHELEEAEIIPYDKNFKESFNGQIWDINPSLTDKQIDFNESALKHEKQYPVLHEKGRVGVLMKGLFGYNGNPSLIEFIAWLSSVLGLLYLWTRIKRKVI